MGGKFSSRLGWLQVPSLILGSWLVGLALAISHHLFYALLNDRLTAADSNIKLLGTSISEQQFNIALGTVFAFLTKAAFVLAVSTTYYQAAWWAVKRRSQPNKTQTLAEVDSVFAAAGDIISLLSSKFWYRYPLLFVLALPIWLIPIAAVVTPATLSVRLSLNPKTVLEGVAMVDFSSTAFINRLDVETSLNGPVIVYSYAGPSNIMRRAAKLVALRNGVLPIPVPFPNSSWTAEFHGPSLKCSRVSAADSLRFQKNIADFLAQEGCSYMPNYISWFPGINPTLETEPYVRIIDTTLGPQINVGKREAPLSPLTFQDPSVFFGVPYLRGAGPKDPGPFSPNATLYTVVLPNMLDTSHAKDPFYFPEYGFDPLTCVLPNSTPANPLGIGGGNVTAVECQLHNSTYTTAFKYINGAQQIKAEIQRHSLVPVINSFDGEQSTDCFKGANLNVSYYDCILPPERRQVSYQAILQAFGSIIVGNVTQLIHETNKLKESSEVRYSPLVYSRELSLLKNFYAGSGSGNNRDSEEIFHEGEDISQLRPLEEVIEAAFQDFVISLMGLQAVQLKPPMRANVTRLVTENVYMYDPFKLWMAYGAATATTTLCVIAGLYLIFAKRNNTPLSYRANFSTIFRVTQSAELGVKIEKGDMDGRAPLPAYLAHATIAIGQTCGGKEEEEGGAEMEDVALIEGERV